MATVWVTYSWEDNRQQDVDYIACELRSKVTVKLDRWDIGAGLRLWEQIGDFICDPGQSDAWLLVATQNSLANEHCREELAYALKRALSERGDRFPVIALFPAHIDESLIPPSIGIRLHVDMRDPHWVERVAAAAQGRPPCIPKPEIAPYFVFAHRIKDRFAIEVRPRAGLWAPFMAGVPIAEKENIKAMMVGPKDRPVISGVLMPHYEGISLDKSMWLMSYRNECTTSMSYYIWCKELPSRLVFGVADGTPQFIVEFDQQ